MTMTSLDIEDVSA